MLEKERPDILHIATHPDSHWYYCSMAEQYGIPVVVCEKPLADTITEAKKIAALHQSGKITIITNHERRYSADYTLARKILTDEERLGLCLGVKGTLYMGKNRRLIDQLWHDGTHLADAVMFLTGSVLKHRKTIAKDGLQTRSGTAYLSGVLHNPAASSIPCLLEVGAGRDHLVFELEFSCERGKLKIGNKIFELWESKESPYAEGFKSLEKCREGFTEKTGYFSNMVSDAVFCAQKRLAQKNPTPLSSAADGLRVIQYLRSVGVWH